MCLFALLLIAYLLACSFVISFVHLFISLFACSFIWLIGCLKLCHCNIPLASSLQLYLQKYEKILVVVGLLPGLSFTTRFSSHNSFSRENPGCKDWIQNWELIWVSVNAAHPPFFFSSISLKRARQLRGFTDSKFLPHWFTGGISMQRGLTGEIVDLDLFNIIPSQTNSRSRNVSKPSTILCAIISQLLVGPCEG